MVRLFTYSSAVILLSTAAAKFISSAGNAKILMTYDPLTGLKFNQLLLLIASIEAIVALVCIFGRPPAMKVSLVAWLATSFLVYRIGLVFFGWHKPCSCLGNLTDALHIPPQTADTGMKIILAYLLIGSYGILFWFWQQKRKMPLATAGIGTSAPPQSP